MKSGRRQHVVEPSRKEGQELVQWFLGRAALQAAAQEQPAVPMEAPRELKMALEQYVAHEVAGRQGATHEVAVWGVLKVQQAP